jgi:hypothetical protein
MRNNFFYKAVFTIISFFVVVCCASQQTTKLNATVDRSKILIGEPIQLKLQADIPEHDPIRFFSIDSIPHFEFLSIERIDTTNTGSGTILSQVLHITSFDSGHWVIPPFIVGELSTDSIPVDVGFSPFNPEQPYHDVKEIIDVEAEEKAKKPTWWYYLAAAIVVLILVLVLLKKKKKPVVVQTVAPPDPYQVALKQLAALKNEKKDIKEYYSRLVDIFRVYVADRKGIHSLQATTDDLVVQLKALGLDKSNYEQLAGTLRQSDFVKYAKHVPSTEEDQQAFDVIHRSIQQIEQLA